MAEFKIGAGRVYEGAERLKYNFLTGLATRFNGMENALGSHNMYELEKYAHQLKGTAGCFGITELQLLASNVEAAASRGDDLGCKRLIDRMKQISRELLN